MLRSAITALAVAVALLAVPSFAFAQSAGDQQYTDPLAGQHHNTHSGGGGTKGGSSGSSGSGTATPSGTIPAASASPQASAASTPSGTTARSQLPRTGFDVIVTVELGLAMLLSGLVAQRMLMLRDRPRPSLAPVDGPSRAPSLPARRP
jgi:hypothetical protein